MRGRRSNGSKLSSVIQGVVLSLLRLKFAGNDFARHTAGQIREAKCMNKQEVIDGLGTFRDRLLGEVLTAYQERGSAFGRDRFNAWRRSLTKFLNEHMPSEVVTLDNKLSHVAFAVFGSESDAQQFWREDGESMVAYLDSLILDVRNDEFDFHESSNKSKQATRENDSETDFSKIFIVHGHDEGTKERTARFIENLGLDAVILQEKASRGKTIIEKIEEYSDVGFAVVLYTPDDLGNEKSKAEDGSLNNRARQNVVFEHGYLMAKLGRDRVVPLVSGRVELPSDISGIVYISDEGWQVSIAKEMKAAGYAIDFNSLL